jgi:hypothetical protein
MHDKELEKQCCLDTFRPGDAGSQDPPIHIVTASESEITEASERIQWEHDEIAIPHHMCVPLFLSVSPFGS